MQTAAREVCRAPARRETTEWEAATVPMGTKDTTGTNFHVAEGRVSGNSRGSLG